MSTGTRTVENIIIKHYHGHTLMEGASTLQVFPANCVYIGIDGSEKFWQYTGVEVVSTW